MDETGTAVLIILPELMVTWATLPSIGLLQEKVPLVVVLSLPLPLTGAVKEVVTLQLTIKTEEERVKMLVLFAAMETCPARTKPGVHSPMSVIKPTVRVLLLPAKSALMVVKKEWFVLTTQEAAVGIAMVLLIQSAVETLPSAIQQLWARAV